MEMNSLSIKIKELRAKREWTQDELSKRAGVPRTNLASIETGKVAKPGTDTLLKLASAFNIRPEELYQAAGYIKDGRVSYQNPLTIEEYLELAKLVVPGRIPIYTAYPCERYTLNEQIGFLYRDRNKTKKSLESYVIYGGKPLMEPEIKGDDIIIVDREGEIKNGNIVACLFHDMLHLGKLRKIGDDLWLENNKGERIRFAECEVPAVVIELVRGLK